MSMAYFEYVKIVADHIAGCANDPAHLRITIGMAAELLDELDVTQPEANWFWQQVADDLLTRRRAEGQQRAAQLQLAAMAVLNELASDGPVL